MESQKRQQLAAVATNIAAATAAAAAMGNADAKADGKGKEVEVGREAVAGCGAGKGGDEEDDSSRPRHTPHQLLQACCSCLPPASCPLPRPRSRPSRHVPVTVCRASMQARKGQARQTGRHCAERRLALATSGIALSCAFSTGPGPRHAQEVPQAVPPGPRPIGAAPRTRGCCRPALHLLPNSERIGRVEKQGTDGRGQDSGGAARGARVRVCLRFLACARTCHER